MKGSRITIEIDNAETVSHNLSDLLCWWQGFKAGIRNEEFLKVLTSAGDNGIEAARELNLKIKDKLKPF